MIILCIFNINYILLEISGSHSNIISDSYVFHYDNELASRTGNKEIRHFVTTNYDQKYPFAPCKFQRVSRLGSVTARHSSIGLQPNFAALNIGRHLYSAGRPSRCALAHILVSDLITCLKQNSVALKELHFVRVTAALKGKLTNR